MPTRETAGNASLPSNGATGAAVACSDRKVICLEGDGSGMYTLQALWTQARESLDVTTLLFSNRSYAILRGELANVGAGNPGRKALDMLDLGHPDLDWVGLARSMGVPGARVTTMDAFNDRFAEGIATPGPFLVEVVRWFKPGQLPDFRDPLLAAVVAAAVWRVLRFLPNQPVTPLPRYGPCGTRRRILLRTAAASACGNITWRG